MSRNTVPADITVAETNYTADNTQPLSRDANIGNLPLVLTQEECAAFLRLGRSKTYELLRQGVIPSIRLGKQYRVPRELLLSWLEQGNEAGSRAPVGGEV